MNLAERAQQTLNNFDPKKDNVNAGGNGLPAGTYTTTIEKIDHRVYDSGFDCFQLVFQVLEGEHAGEKEMYNISFATVAKSGNPIPDFIIDRSMKFVSKLSDKLGKNAIEAFSSDNETDVHENLKNLLKSEEGTTIELIIDERPNKKDPANPYKEYDLGEVTKADAIDIDDEDLPF